MSCNSKGLGKAALDKAKLNVVKTITIDIKIETDLNFDFIDKSYEFIMEFQALGTPPVIGATVPVDKGAVIVITSNQLQFCLVSRYEKNTVSNGNHFKLSTSHELYKNGRKSNYQ